MTKDQPNDTDQRKSAENEQTEREADYPENLGHGEKYMAVADLADKPS